MPNFLTSELSEIDHAVLKFEGRKGKVSWRRDTMSEWVERFLKEGAAADLDDLRATCGSRSTMT